EGPRSIAQERASIVDKSTTMIAASRYSLRPNFSGDHGPEQFSMLPAESRHLHLLDREIIGRARVDFDAWQQQSRFEVLEVGGLSHDVFAGEFIAALLEHLDHGLCCQIAIDTERARLIP